MSKETTKKAEPKKAAKGKAEKAPDAVTPEIMPGGEAEPPKSVVRHKGDEMPLELLQTSIKRDIQLAGRLDKVSAMVSIKIGLALNAGKEMLKHGAFEPWVYSQFGEDFGARKAQYFTKLAKVFVLGNMGKLALPSPKETGNWLAVRDEGSDLAVAVAGFVGDLSLAELLDKHKIKASKARGGYNPSAFMLNRYLQDHPKLTGIPFDGWTDEQRDDFRKWADAHNDGDSGEARAMAAEGAWAAIRRSLEDQGMSRSSWKLLKPQDLQDTADVMKDVLTDINKALKLIEKSK